MGWGRILKGFKKSNYYMYSDKFPCRKMSTILQKQIICIFLFYNKDDILKYELMNTILLVIISQDNPFILSRPFNTRYH